MLAKEKAIYEIHQSLINGQRQQMIKQIKAYGLYDFWSDYADYLSDICNKEDEYNYFKDATMSYFRITNR
jgi:hypothetical protein